MTSMSESKISMQNTQLEALPTLEGVRFQKLPALQWKKVTSMLWLTVAPITSLSASAVDVPPPSSDCPRIESDVHTFELSSEVPMPRTAKVAVSFPSKLSAGRRTTLTVILPTGAIVRVDIRFHKVCMKGIGSKPHTHEARAQIRV